MKSEALPHGRVLDVKLLPQELLLALGSTRGQRWVKGEDLVKPWVIVMLLPTTQLLTFVSTINTPLPAVGVHCKGGTRRSDYGNRRFFAKKHPVMANIDLLGSKGFRE